MKKGLLMYVGIVVPTDDLKEQIEKQLGKELKEGVKLSDPIQVELGNYDSIKKKLRKQDVHVLLVAETMETLDGLQLVRDITFLITNGEGYLWLAERGGQKFVKGSPITVRFTDELKRLF